MQSAITMLSMLLLAACFFVLGNFSPPLWTTVRRGDVGFSARLSAAPAVGPVMTMYVDGEAQAWIQLTPEVVAKIQEGLIKYGYVGTGKYTVKYVMPDATTVEVRLSAAGGVGRTDSPITQP